MTLRPMHKTQKMRLWDLAFQWGVHKVEMFLFELKGIDLQSQSLDGTGKMRTHHRGQLLGGYCVFSALLWTIQCFLGNLCRLLALDCEIGRIKFKC